MATSTTNLGLTKPAGTDKIRIAQINGNMDILDEKIGAVGNTSLQAQVTSQNEAITTLNSNIEIDVGSFGGTLENALSSACSSFYSTVGTNDVVRRVKILWSTYGNILFGQMLRRNNKVFFSLAVHENGMYVGEYTISTSTLVFRSITDQIDSLNNKLSTTSPTVTKTANIKTNSVVSAKRNANVVSIYMDIYAVSTSSEYVNIASLSEAPSTNVYFVMIDANDGAKMCRLTSNGELQIHGTVADRNYMGSLTYIVNS